MKTKIKKLATGISIAAMTLPVSVLAQWEGAENQYSVGSGLTDQPIGVILNNVMRWLLGLIAVLAIIAFVISGILYLTAAGDEDRIATAKKVMTYAIIGVVVALLGLIILTTISAIIEGTV